MQELTAGWSQLDDLRGLALAPVGNVLVIGVLVRIRLVMTGLRLLVSAVGRSRREAPRAGLRLTCDVLGAVLAVAPVVVSVVLHKGAPRPDDFYTVPDQVPRRAGRAAAGRAVHHRHPARGTGRARHPFLRCCEAGG